jgi:hypothetical protein
MALTPAQCDIAFEMVIFVAELMIDHHKALGGVRKWQLPRHADAAVHLDALFSNASECPRH